MIRGHEDLFVGVVGICVGLFLLVAAVANWDWYYSLPSARFLTCRLGRTGARLFHASVAVAVIALGVAVTQGMRFSLPLGG